MKRRIPIVSVLMSAYNSEAFVAEAVESILGQTLADFQFVIIDDGSTDHTPEILQDYADRDPRIELHRRTNHGLTASLNYGLQHCTGEYIARMDADDISEPERLAEQVAFLDSAPDHVAVGCAVRMIDADGTITGDKSQPTDSERIEAKLLAGYGNAIPHPGVTTRRTALEEVGGYREQFVTAQDLDLYLRLAGVGKLANLPAFLLRYRRHGEAVGARKVEQQFRDVRAILADAYAARNRALPREVIDRWRRLVSNNLMHQSRASVRRHDRLHGYRLALMALRYSPADRNLWVNFLRLGKATFWPRATG